VIARPTAGDYAAHPLDAQLKRLAATADDLAAALAGHDGAALGRRPAPRAWAAVEIVCHLRDIEEIVLLRFRQMLAMDEPKLIVAGDMPPDLEAWGLAPGEGPPVDPVRWAEERQYLRADATGALAAFRRRRDDTLAFLRRLTPAQWQRAGLHPSRGRVTLGDWPALMAGHDDNHLDQLRRALTGNA
jgi:hypothetical protein